MRLLVSRKREPFFQHRFEVDQLHRLAQIIVHADCAAMLGFALERIGGEGDNRNMPPVLLFFGADGGGQLVAIHLRHVQVAEDQRIVITVPALQCCIAVVGDICGEPEQRKLRRITFWLVSLSSTTRISRPCRRASSRNGGLKSSSRLPGQRCLFFFFLYLSRSDSHRLQQTFASEGIRI